MYKKIIIILLICGIILSCRGVVGLIDTPEGIANKFLIDLYHLSFDEIPSVAAGQALMQAALMEGYADSFSKEERMRYSLSEILVTLVTIRDDDHAAAEYTVTFSDGYVIQNTLILEKKDHQWWVVSFHQPIISPTIYQYLIT
ncbi:hypothetical protein PVA44_02600 [Entomospira nematocerorum]|uniref:DUF4878 domain-containing protein n=1 Tax=Entomospira nematocerorum TaxID=2719987 RepID=A0A968GH67_9SPIO|nr:hypothetical protein [Entomospira nematocera]NIZ47076.1 hypothetical protein [Entomospira nematocera]WDI34379.1 hypothetical protein PVA44_02600 [Entomospira nematocera]